MRLLIHEPKVYHNHEECLRMHIITMSSSPRSTMYMSSKRSTTSSSPRMYMPSSIICMGVRASQPSVGIKAQTKAQSTNHLCMGIIHTCAPINIIIMCGEKAPTCVRDPIRYTKIMCKCPWFSPCLSIKLVHCKGPWWHQGQPRGHYKSLVGFNDNSINNLLLFHWWHNSLTPPKIMLPLSASHPIWHQWQRLQGYPCQYGSSFSLAHVGAAFHYFLVTSSPVTSIVFC